MDHHPETIYERICLEASKMRVKDETNILDLKDTESGISLQQVMSSLAQDYLTLEHKSYGFPSYMEYFTIRHICVDLASSKEVAVVRLKMRGPIPQRPSSRILHLARSYTHNWEINYSNFHLSCKPDTDDKEWAPAFYMTWTGIAQDRSVSRKILGDGV